MTRAIIEEVTYEEFGNCIKVSNSEASIEQIVKKKCKYIEILPK